MSYDALWNTIRTDYRVEKEIKQSERGRIVLLRSRKTKERRILRTFTGQSEVYRKLQDIQSVHLPKIEAVASREDQVTVLEEYIPGDTLYFILQNGPLAPGQAAAIAEQLCLALEILHRNGIVHRDIKPENVILSGDKAVLIDFDASRVYSKKSSSDTQIMGTAGYAAPEQFGFSQTDARADIYALGVLFNEMLTGQHPSRKLAAPPYQRIIAKCIEVNVDRRCSSVAELRSALVHTKWHRKRWLWGAAIALGAALLCLSAAHFVLAGKAAAVPTQSPTAAETPAPTPTPVPTPTPTPKPTPTPTPSPTPSPTPKPLFTLQPELWQGSSYDRTTEFTFDADGDGVKETYLFGITTDNPNSGLYAGILRTESMGVPDDKLYAKERPLIPCIWRKMPDGQYEVAPEMKQYLNDPSVTVWRLPWNDSPAPLIYPLETDFGWDGGIMVKYIAENRGSWLYLAKGTVDGKELKAVAQTWVESIAYFQNRNGNGP